MKQAVEANFKSRLDSVFNSSKYKVVGSTTEEERPNPCVIVIGGEFEPAFSELSDSMGNYTCNLTILVLSSIDVEGVREHSDACSMIASVFDIRETRRSSVVQKLHIYDCVKLNVSEENDNQERKIGTAFNFKVVLHYED